MNPQILILLVIVSILGLFIWGKYRHDFVATAGLIACVILGLVKPIDAFSGFSHPATITVALVLILSYSLLRSGATDTLDRLVKKSTSTPYLHIFVLAILAGVLSMFINNIATLAIFMPLAIASCKSAKRSPSTVLMPLSFGSILGGLVTVIGTPPNIIIASYRETTFGEPFHMFDFTPVGGCIAIIGILFIASFGWKLIKVRKKVSDEDGLFTIESYTFEVTVTEKSKIVGKTIKEIDEMTQDLDLNIFSLVHTGQRFTTAKPSQKVESDDILSVEGTPEVIDKFITKFNLNIVSPSKVDKAILHSPEADTFEVIVTPSSRLVGRLANRIPFQSKFNINILGISRKGRPYRGRLKNIKIRSGDVLLLHGNRDFMGNAINLYDLLPLAERQVDVGRRKFDGIKAISIFSICLALASFKILPIYIALAIAVLAMIVLKILPIRELYTRIDWPVIVLLGAMIPVGSALDSTGATELLANSLLSLASGLSPIYILTIILIITMTLSDILNNAATAILMAPISVLIAKNLEVNPDAFLMSVAIGASCAFLTPIGHQNNILIMGAGGYKFGDYWRLGLPLEVIIVCTAVPLIAVFFPL